MKGFIFNEDFIIVKIIHDIVEINESKRFIRFGKDSMLNGIDFAKLNLIVSDSLDALVIGDIMPEDVKNKKDQIIFKSERELIEQLQQENSNLMFQLVLGGVI